MKSFYINMRTAYLPHISPLVNLGRSVFYQTEAQLRTSPLKTIQPSSWKQPHSSRVASAVYNRRLASVTSNPNLPPPPRGWPPRFLPCRCAPIRKCRDGFAFLLFFVGDLMMGAAVSSPFLTRKIVKKRVKQFSIDVLQWTASGYPSHRF
jgi:hypothetical protein